VTDRLTECTPLPCVNSWPVMYGVSGVECVASNRHTECARSRRRLHSHPSHVCTGSLVWATARRCRNCLPCPCLGLGPHLGSRGRGSSFCATEKGAHEGGRASRPSSCLGTGCSLVCPRLGLGCIPATDNNQQKRGPVTCAATRCLHEDARRGRNARVLTVQGSPQL
jgi:hypothetical protein